MTIFKTRKEVKRLQSQVDDLTSMLKTHFDIKWTLEDFANFCDEEPEPENIPVTRGEWIRYRNMIGPRGGKVTRLFYRGILLKIMEKGNLND